MKEKPIFISPVSKDIIKKIDEGARLSRRSRSQFLIYCALKETEKLQENNITK